MDTTEIKQVKEIKLKYLSEKQNEHGTNHFFEVLDITLLQELIELGKTMKFRIWQYNGKYYLKTNDVKVKEFADLLREDALHIGTCFKQDLLYIKDLQNMISRRTESKLLVIQFLKLHEFVKSLIYRTGIVRIKFKYYH